jgi:transcription elongation GreA/GreB family factor
VLGAKVGETVNYTEPNGKQVDVAVLEEQPFI